MPIGRDIWLRLCQYEHHECNLFLCPHMTNDVQECGSRLVNEANRSSFGIFAPAGDWTMHVEAFEASALWSLAPETLAQLVPAKYGLYDPNLLPWIAESNRVHFQVRCVPTLDPIETLSQPPHCCNDDRIGSTGNSASSVMAQVAALQRRNGCVGTRPLQDAITSTSTTASPGFLLPCGRCTRSSVPEI